MESEFPRRDIIPQRFDKNQVTLLFFQEVFCFDFDFVLT